MNEGSYKDRQTLLKVSSFKYAGSGLLHALRREKNFRRQLVFGLFVIILALLLNFSRTEWLVLLLTICLVLTAELLNTVIELLVDLVTEEKFLPKAKLTKDVSAAFVLLISIFSLVLGMLLFIPHLLKLIF